MGEDTLMRIRKAQIITVERIQEAINMVCYRQGRTIEGPEPVCDWPKLCGEHCKFPRYYTGAQPTGLVAHVLMELGYPVDLLKALDCEYEISELLHPGVKIGRSRNQALARIVPPGMKLLSYLQNHQKVGWSWNDISLNAFKPRWTVKYLDSRRRPWLY